MEPAETESFAPLPPEVNTSQNIGQASVNPPRYQNLYGLNQDQRERRPTNADWELKQLHLAFQDSHLSPVFPLLPSTSGVQQNITEYSFFHQSDLEFAPLRASPDVSVTSERFHFLPQGRTSQASEHGSLSQHPLAQATVLTDDAVSSCCSLSQHSMSPGDEGRKGEMVHSPVTEDHLQEMHFSVDGMENNDGDGHGHPLSNLSVKPVEEAAEEVEDTSFLRGDVPARQLLERLQKDVGMPSGSSSAVSSASETSLKRMGSFSGESEGVLLPDADQSRGRRDSPTGTATFTQQQQTPQLKLESQSGKSHPQLSDVSNITMGSRNTQPDDTSEALHRELLSEIERRNSSEAGYKVQPLSAPTPNLDSVTGKPNMARVILAGMCGEGPQFSGSYSVENGMKQRGLLSLGNQTGNDGSFLGFLPQSQSTPGVFYGPDKLRVKAPSDRLSAIESNMRASYESSSRVSQQSVVMPDIVSLDPVTSRHGGEKSCQEETGSGEVQGLPSLNYMQKVDAWRANQSSAKISLFDNLALQGFSGISPKKNAYNAISDSLNHILLNQQEKTTQYKLPDSSTTNPSVTQSSALTQSSSSPRRGEAVGSAPNEMDNTGSGAGLSSSPLGRSQSHSSLSTVVTSIQKAQHTERLTKGEMSQNQEPRLQQISAVVQPSPLLSLGRFSDVSLDREVSSTLSNSQHSYHSGQNLGASVGVASSVVSLEVDNYAPYWSSIPSSPLPPPKPRELNIEERIPLYLHNLGIDQSPSTILTPFGPRGPIREPEFSPTDLCTIKGSIGTSPKSTQPSEGGTPHKADFSRYSLLSVDSSMSIPLSMDSLCQPVHFLDQARASPQSDVVGGHAAVPSSQPQHAPYLPAPQPDQQQQRDDSVGSSQNTIQLGDQFVSESSLVTGCRESESHSQPTIVEQSNQFVGDKTLREIRKLLGQAGDDVAAGGSSKASLPSSSSSSTSPLHSNDNILLSLRKRTGGFQDSSFISSASGTEGPETRSSFLWTRSSSDSMLMSERQRESSIGRESMSSSGQPNYPSTLAPSSPPAVEGYIRPQDSTADGGAGLYLHLSKSVRRAEPEGCSAAPPDGTGPAPLPIVPQQPTVSQPQPALSPRETIGSFSEQEEEGNVQDNLYSQRVPTESGSSSSPPIPGEEQEAMSNASSSESSLAARVAKLLHNESPATLLSSRSSTTDQEESRAREWIKLKITGQQSDPLELDFEDRRRIEEIKREQKHLIQSQGSTDTESSSAASSMGNQGGQLPPQPAETATTLKTAENHLSRQLQQHDTNPFDSSVQLHTTLRLDLESRVQEIAAREGLTLTRASPAPPALTSITISTCRRSTSPSPSPSPAPPLSPPPPEPLCLTQLSTANKQLPHLVEEDNATASIQAKHADPVSIQPILGSVSASSLYAREQNLSASELIPRSHGRQDAIGGRNVESLQGQPKEEERVNVRDSYTDAQWQRDLQGVNTTAQPEDQGTDQLLTMPDQLNSGSDMGLMTEQATGSSTVDASTSTGHVSHIHLTLSPKAQEQRQNAGIQPMHAAAVPDLKSSRFYPLRHSSSPATRSRDEGLGLSSPLESCESRDVIRARVPERADTATLFKTMVHEGTETSTYPQSYIPTQKLAASTRPLAIPTPAVPVLLPYKPHGSEELFYVPQTEASPCRSDTTMESSHPGSDDAVPPHFSSEVLGKLDHGIDRGVSIRHVEGIYSKRLKTATFKMQPTRHSGSTVSVDESSQTSMSQVPQPSSQVSEAFTRVPLSSNQAPSGSRRDRGTSPVQFLSYGQSESVGFQPISVEMDSNTASQRPSAYLASDTVAAMEREQGRCRPDLPQPASRPSGSNLDQLWRKFNERWGSEERHPTSEREVSLLERLERLSRLIHSTAGVHTLSQPEDSMQPHPHNNEDEPRKRGEDAAMKKRERKENVGPLERKSVSGEGGQRRGKPTAPCQAWTQEAEQQTPLAEDCVHFSFSPSRHRCPAERDESDTTSTLSGSMSTVDTARLIRAFGPDRVRCLKSASSLSKLYSTIDKQKETKEQRRTRERDRDITPPTIITPSETTVTDDSIVASDSASSTSTYTLPTRRGPSQCLAAKKSVKQVNKGIQAGDLEIVSNGTRRHTRDVGTTFPSPGEARGPRLLPSSSSSSLERGKRDERSPSKTQVFMKERKTKRSHGKHYPQGVTWFVPAEHLRSEARKENQPEEDEQWAQRPSSAWFQPYSRTPPWREPLRERQLQEEWNSTHTRPDPDPRDKTTSSGLVRVSLQEALELHRPTFIAHSRERMKRLALQAEERKLQVLLSRERDQFYTRTGRPERLPRPEGLPLFRRAVPRKEMVQRSKQIYENLPEVQRRRDEQRRKAEYQSYRLNAQLFNKKVTNRVLARRVPWH